MAFEPINIFSHKIDPAGVAKLMLKLAPNAAVNGPADDWSEIQAVTTKGGLFRRGKKLILVHDAAYYDGDDWGRQVLGMQGYFSDFPETPNKSEILQLIRSFRFSLSVPVDDLDIDSSDDRLDILFAVCRHLDAAIFTPSSLRDSSGRILIDAHGFVDSSAILPQLPPTDDHPDAADPVDDEFDEEDPEPPTPLRVAQRTLALTAVATRATIELDHLQGALDVDEGERHRQRMLSWIADLNIDDEFEPQEWKVIQRPVGALEQQDFINAMWRVEGLAVLAWSLQLHPIPVYDELVIPIELYESIGLNDVEAGKKLLDRPTLRSDDEIQGMSEHLLALHWRLRDFSIRPESMDFVEFSKECWFGSFDLSDFRTVDRDLAIGDIGIIDTDPEEVSRVGSIAMERHTAINWLRGYGSSVYSEVTADT